MSTIIVILFAALFFVLGVLAGAALAQAGALLDVLYATLPGGTLDALLYLMLEREAGIYRVSYAQARGEK